MHTLDERREVTAELLDSLGRLIRTSKALRHHHTAEFGLTGTPFGILRTLGEGDARPGDLALHLQVAPSVVSRAVVPLEQSRLVERRTDPADARAWRLGLTEAGRRRLADARREFVDRLIPVLHDWDSTDIATLSTLMGRLERTVARGLEPADTTPTSATTNVGHS